MKTSTPFWSVMTLPAGTWTASHSLISSTRSIRCCFLLPIVPILSLEVASAAATQAFDRNGRKEPPGCLRPVFCASPFTGLLRGRLPDLGDRVVDERDHRGCALRLRGLLLVLSFRGGARALMLAPVGDRGLDCVLSENGAVDLHRRKMQLLDDRDVLNRHRLVD